MIQDAALTWYLLQESRRSSRRPLAWFRRRQERVLRRLLRHAYDRVPIYRRLYDEAGFHPDAFQTLADLERIPPLTKATLKGAEPADTFAAGTDPASCTVLSTSGSTGIPMQIVLGRYERCWNRAVAWRILFEHGFRWTDRTLEIRMNLGARHAIQRFGIAPKDWMRILDPPQVWAECLVQKRHECVVAGAGTLEILAEEVQGRKIFPPRLVISDSEPLTPKSRARIRELLGGNPVDVYGLEEVSNFAWECEHHDGMHVSADSHVVEVAAPVGAVGSLTVTALGMWTMPFIRYETGDMAQVAGHACPCGRTLPLLAAVYGRAIDSIVLPGGQQLLWPFFHELLGQEPEVEQWQAVQAAPATIVVRVALRAPQPLLIAKIESVMRHQLPPGVQIRVHPEESIPLEANGKRRLVIPFSGDERQDAASRWPCVSLGAEDCPVS